MLPVLHHHAQDDVIIGRAQKCCKIDRELKGLEVQRLQRESKYWVFILWEVFFQKQQFLLLFEVDEAGGGAGNQTTARRHRDQYV